MMESQSYNNKRIFKNTIILYVRMVIVLLITLYTSRVVLKALGVDDFGLYNVVGGVVALLSFFNVTMARSTQRFLNVAMVEGGNMLSKIFASSITVHLMFVIIFLVLGETVGLWFLNAKINIPEGRELAANIVYQASIVSFCISIISIPYNAAVIAYERMGFFHSSAIFYYSSVSADFSFQRPWSQFLIILLYSIFKLNETLHLASLHHCIFAYCS